jgi:hypothetical protein
VQHLDSEPHRAEFITAPDVLLQCRDTDERIEAVLGQRDCHDRHRTAVITTGPMTRASTNRRAAASERATMTNKIRPFWRTSKLRMGLAPV